MRKALYLFLLLIFTTLSAFTASSCSIMLPYHESFECSRGTNGGYCGPINKVYKETLIQQQKKESGSWSN